MKIVPYMDIVGDDRIDGIMSDPGNFVLRALRAETPIDWIPDVDQGH